MSELKIENYFHVIHSPEDDFNKEVYNIADLPEEKRKEIGRLLNERGLESVGYKKKDMEQA